MSTFESEAHTNMGLELAKVREETEARVQNFLSENCVRYVIALTGDSESEGPVASRNMDIIEDFISSLNDRDRYAIQTGGTVGGVPQMGIEVARKYGMPTIGIHPGAYRKYSMGDSLDFILETPHPIFGPASFGTETPTFVNTIDGSVILGGSFGTRTEVSTMLKSNKGRVKDGKIPIYICPILGTGKVADETYGVVDIDPTYDALPDPAVTTGKQAAEFMNSKLPITN